MIEIQIPALFKVEAIGIGGKIAPIVKPFSNKHVEKAI